MGISTMIFRACIFILISGLSFTTKASMTNMTQAGSVERASKISNISYNLDIHLKKNEKFYGEVEVSFKLNDTSTSIPLDFFKGTIEKLVVNGADISKPVYNGQFIEIEKDLLVHGQNLVQVKYSRSYNTNGKGLTRIKDKKDGRVYVYSQFETMAANQFFPCFDQPNLKAYYTLKVTAPQSWKVITSVREKRVRYNRNKERIWYFPRSAKFSSYLISLHAGPFKVWSSMAGKIPLRLFARQSVAKQVNYKKWFQITKQGFSFFQKEFSYPYPYKKYDQLIVPEFFSGAMENVGAVTFNERYFVSSGKMNRSQLLDMASTIHHEMAHMWFGNLVTMNWWNDLWLNESFATYAAAKSLNRSTEFSESWRKFYIKYKGWAYSVDRSVNTHAIESKIEDVFQASVMFDGISYGKGAAVLKQLNYYVGEKVFQKGVRNYFKKYAGQNTELSDFVGELSRAAGRDLTSWSDKWLKTSGVNIISTLPICKGGKLSKLRVIQELDSVSKVLRPHKFKVALMYKKNKSIQLGKAVDIELNQAEVTVSVPGGLSCPDLVYPNYGDHGYFQVRLDQVTVSHMMDQIDQIKDNFLRSMFWNSVWLMVLEGDLSVYKYSDLLLSQALDESDATTLQNNLSRIYEDYAGRESVSYFLPQETAVQKYKKTSILAQFETKFLEKLKKAKPGSDMQRIWFDEYVKSIGTAAGIENLTRILSGEMRFKKMKLDQQRRWTLLKKLSTVGFPGLHKLVEKEAKKDKSDAGALALLAIEASHPNWENKKKLINRLEGKKHGFSRSQVRFILGNIFPPNQGHFREMHADQHFKKIENLLQKKTVDVDFVSTFNWLSPQECRGPQKNLSQSFLDSHPNLHPQLLKQMRFKVQQAERCRKILAKAKIDQS